MRSCLRSVSWYLKHIGRWAGALKPLLSCLRRTRRKQLEEGGAAGQWRRRRLVVDTVVLVLAAEWHLWRGDRRRRATLQEPRHHGRIEAVGTLVACQARVRAGGSLEETAVHALALAAVPVTWDRCGGVVVTRVVLDSWVVRQIWLNPDSNESSTVESAVKIRDISRVGVKSRWSPFESELSQLDSYCLSQSWGIYFFLKRKR